MGSMMNLKVKSLKGVLSDSLGPMESMGPTGPMASIRPMGPGPGPSLWAADLSKSVLEKK